MHVGHLHRRGEGWVWEKMAFRATSGEPRTVGTVLAQCLRFVEWDSEEAQEDRSDSLVVLGLASQRRS